MKKVNFTKCRNKGCNKRRPTNEVGKNYTCGGGNKCRWRHSQTKGGK